MKTRTWISCAALVWGLSASARAAELRVNVVEDGVDATPGDGVCSTGRTTPAGAPACSLRAAIMEANALGNRVVCVPRPGDGACGSYRFEPPHVLHVPAGTYRLTLRSDNGAADEESPGPPNDRARYNDLDLAVQAEIRGAGRDATFVESTFADRVLEIAVGTTWAGGYPLSTRVLVSGLTLRNGVSLGRPGGGIDARAARFVVLEDVALERNVANFRNENGILYLGRGGGIHAAAAVDLALTRCVIRGNTANTGGGVFAEGFVTATDTTIEGNRINNMGYLDQYQGMGGGIAGLSLMTVLRSTISGNVGNAGGGLGVYFALRMVNSTVSGNSAAVGGAVRFFPGVRYAQIQFSTIAGNTASFPYDGALSWTRPTTTPSYTSLDSTILAGNTGASCAQVPGGIVVASSGHNLESADSCRLRQPTDLVRTDPRLGALRDNGGPTWTHALPWDSPAVDRGGAFPVSWGPTDQRGLPRPKGAAADIGAFEYQPLVAVGVFAPIDWPVFISRMFGFSLDLRLDGPAGARIIDVVPASSGVSFDARIGKDGRAVTVTATGLDLHRDDLKKGNGGKDPILFYVSLSSYAPGATFLVSERPRYDGVFAKPVKTTIAGPTASPSPKWTETGGR